MKTSLYIISKYWRKHRKNAFSLILSGMLMAAIIIIMLLVIREDFAGGLDEVYDKHSAAHIVMAYYNGEEELFERVEEQLDKKEYPRCTLNVIDTVGEPYLNLWYCTAQGDTDLLHIEMESGRLPQAENEAAVERTALDLMHWVGKVGGEITLNGNTYTLVGIIDEDFGRKREGSPFFEGSAENSEISGEHLCVPLIYVGASDREPVYKIDMLGDVYDTRDTYYQRILQEYSGIYDAFRGYAYEKYGDEPPIWITGPYEYSLEMYGLTADAFGSLEGINSYKTTFLLYMTAIGAAISVLSVFSVLRGIFTQRRNRIEILKRIGMSRKRIAGMYALECGAFTLIQTAAGMLAGALVYQAVYAFKTTVLGVKAYSAFTSDATVLKFTTDPFFTAVVFSVSVMVTAYIITVLTSGTRKSAPRKDKKPRSLSRCMSRIFSTKGISVVQTAALTLICFSVIMGYMFYTDSGKTVQEDSNGGFDLFGTTGDVYMPLSFNAGGFDMEEYGIAEYYESAAPTLNSIGTGDTGKFVMAQSSYSAGIDDTAAEKLPRNIILAGAVNNQFIISDSGENEYENMITLDQGAKDMIISFSADKYKYFFDEGQIGSKKLYQSVTRLAGGKDILSLGNYVVQGKIDLDKLNSGEELLLVTESKNPPFTAGETVSLGTVCFSEENPYGINELERADVKIGAVICLPQATPDSPLSPVLRSAVRNSDTQGTSYNFLTTATGAKAMGITNASYTQIYCFEPIDGTLIPTQAQMSMTSLETLQREELMNKASQYGTAVLLLIIMSILGFAAYFNGIGMKIRLKSYQISVLRAVGTSKARIRKKLLSHSLKIPLIASVSAYAVLKLLQRAAYVGLRLSEEALPDGVTLEESHFAHQKEIINTFFLYRNWWQVEPEIPAVILFVVISGITLLLTVRALKKFKSGISSDLSEGRTRQ